MTTDAAAAGGFPDAFLDGLRQVADPPADETVALHFARLGSAPAGAMVRSLARHQALPDEERTPAVDAFLASPVTRPGWFDEGRWAEGQRLFEEWGLHIFTALYFGSLPSAYAAARGVQVLHLTARLVTDARRRLNETAQFHLDVMTPGAPTLGSRTVDAARHVRLMHAAVRWLIRNDPDVVRTVDDAPPSGPSGIPWIDAEGPRWSSAWGQPINQEDLLGTLLTFTEVVFEVFSRTGVDISEGDAAAYLHTWSVIGTLLGIREDLLPLRRPAATMLLRRIRERHDATSRAGREMTAALLGLATESLPPGVRGVPATVLRHFVGDPVGDLLGVPKSDWTHALLGPLRDLTAVANLPKHELSPWRHLSERLGRHLLQAMVDSDRFGRPAYSIPTHLADAWDVRQR